jgi:hypothetical protein
MPLSCKGPSRGMWGVSAGRHAASGIAGGPGHSLCPGAAGLSKRAQRRVHRRAPTALGDESRRSTSTVTRAEDGNPAGVPASSGGTGPGRDPGDSSDEAAASYQLTLPPAVLSLGAVAAAGAAAALVHVDLGHAVRLDGDAVAVAVELAAPVLVLRLCLSGPRWAPPYRVGTGTSSWGAGAAGAGVPDCLSPRPTGVRARPAAAQLLHDQHGEPLRTSRPRSRPHQQPQACSADVLLRDAGAQVLQMYGEDDDTDTDSDDGGWGSERARVRRRLKLEQNMSWPAVSSALALWQVRRVAAGHRCTHPKQAARDERWGGARAVTPAWRPRRPTRCSPGTRPRQTVPSCPAWRALRCSWWRRSCWCGPGNCPSASACASAPTPQRPSRTVDLGLKAASSRSLYARRAGGHGLRPPWVLR